MRAKHLRQSIKRQWFTGAFCLIIVILLILSAILGIQLIREMRRNQFSKNIILSNNYFLGAEETGNNSYWLDDIMVQCMEPTEYANKEDFPLDFLVEIRKKLGALDEVDAQEKIQEGLSAIAERYWSGEPVILDVPHLCQNETLPNGCEAVSAAMLLQYCGFSITAEDLWISIWNASR